MAGQIAMTLALVVIMLGGTTALAQDQAAGTQAAEQAAAPAAPLWLMSCSNQMQPDKLLCEFSQSIVMTQGNQSQRIATASFNRVAGQPQTDAIFTLPYGVSLPDPVRVLVDDKEVGGLAWQSCDAGGCYATGPVDETWLQAMRDGNQMTVALKARDGRDLSYSFQLSGFQASENMLP